MGEGPQVKGVAFRSVIRALDVLRGPDIVARAVTAMPEELGSALRYGSLVAAAWYPIDWYRSTWAGVVAGAGEGNGLVQEIARECIRSDLSGVYRVFTRLLAPHTLFSVTPRFFANYYSHGRFEILESRAGYARARWTDCIGWDYFMWLEMNGACEETLTQAGARGARFRVLTGGRDGDTTMEGEAHWS